MFVLLIKITYFASSFKQKEVIMNIKRFIIASLAVFISFEILDFIIHSVILMNAYESLEHIWRPDMMDKMWIMYLTALFFSFMFVYIFTKGYEGKGWIEGARFGLIIGLLMLVVGIFNQYVVFPIPLSLTIQWLIYGLIEYIIIGIVAALIYKPKQVT